MNTVTTENSYTAQDLMIQGYAAYKAVSINSDAPDAVWLMDVAHEIADGSDGEVGVWEAIDNVVENQAAALASRAQGQSCCSVSEWALAAREAA